MKSLVDLMAMLKTTAITSLIFLTSQLQGQNLNDKILNFQKDYYRDSTLYKSEMTYFLEKHKDTLYQKNYPVLIYDYSNVVSDSPLVVKDTFHFDNFSLEPYRYVRKGSLIFIQFYDYSQNKFRLNKEYSMKENDTVNFLIEWSSLAYHQSERGISVGGFSNYLGEREITMNGMKFQTYCFLEDHKIFAEDHYYYKREIYLDKQTLIPIKIIHTSYNFNTGNQEPYYSVTQLKSTGDKIPGFSNEEDLRLYQDTSTTWTPKQKAAFLNQCSPDYKSYCECLLAKLDGHISFYEHEKSYYFKELESSNDCK